MMLVVVIFTVIMLLYFGVIKILHDKKKEFWLFLTIYLFALLCMLCMSYIFTREQAGGNWYLHTHPLRDQLYMAAYYIPPTFLVAYLLYPFKIIKRSRMLIWVLSGYTLIVIGGTALLSILVSSNNM